MDTKRYIALPDLFTLFQIELGDYKIHCASTSDTDPLDEFFSGTFKEWQERQNKENFKCRYIVSLIHLENHKWLFAGIYEVLGVKRGNWWKKNCFRYSTHLTPFLEPFIGRLIIKFNKQFRQSYLIGKNHENIIEVLELRSEPMTIGHFPGYKNVCISFQILNTIFH